MNRRAFTLLELCVCMVLIVMIATLGLASFRQMRGVETRGRCINNLQQLGVATHLYLQDNEGRFFDYRADLPGGVQWWFGFEPTENLPEGDRELDRTRAPLYPYLQRVGGVEVCPAFPYDDAVWKPKFKGASYGYGYNAYLWHPPTHPRTNANLLEIEEPSRVILFGDCAQVNTFQAPASAAKPMVEEFYFFDNTFATAHFRHQSRANFVFVDGHVEALPMAPGTLDRRLPAQEIGRIAPRGSRKYLWDD